MKLHDKVEGKRTFTNYAQP